MRILGSALVLGAMFALSGCMTALYVSPDHHHHHYHHHHRYYP